MAIRASRLWAAKVAKAPRTPAPSFLKGLVREDPSMVPPRGRIPETLSTAKGYGRVSIRPLQPSRKPIISSPAAADAARLQRRADPRDQAWRAGVEPGPARARGPVLRGGGEPHPRPQGGRTRP